MRRVLQRVGGDAFDGAIGDWLTARATASHSADQDRHPPDRPASRGMVIAKVGETGPGAWEARWDAEPTFRHHQRLVTAVWGTVFLLDAALRVVLAYTIPVDAFPLTGTLLWLALLGGLCIWQNWYLTRHGLKL